MSLLRHRAGGAIAHSATFRLSLGFAGLFVACLLVIDLGFGLVARWVIERSARDAVETTLADLKDAFAAGGREAVIRRLDDRSADAAEDGLTLGYRAGDGRPIAGDLAVPAPSREWLVQVPQGAEWDEGLWVRTASLADGTTIGVGVSTEAYHDVRELMLAGAAWTVAIALPMALLSGALLSRTILSRLSSIAETASGVREGALSRRAMLRGTGDEFDRLAGDINTMLDTIETLTRNLRNVSVGIAHELRTPLAHLRNRLVEIKEGKLAPDDTGRSLETALNEIDATLTTFDALLRIGQIEADAERRGFEKVSLADLVADLAEVYEPVVAEKGRLLDLRIDTDLELQGNRALLMQMVANLLENAIEHTPAGTRISLELTRRDGPPQLVVQDDGPGIPEAEGERIFDRFYRLAENRSKRGSGLGLALVRSICSLHGLTVRLSPSPRGARFEISL